MSSVPQIDASKISIVSIRLLKGNIDSTDDAIIKNPLLKGCDTKLHAKNSVNVLNKEFITVLTITLAGLGENNIPIGINAEYTFEIRLRVENLTDYILPSENKVIVIEASLTGTLMSIAYSTSRGIVFTRTLGTVMEGVILPVINPLSIPGVVLKN